MATPPQDGVVLIDGVRHRSGDAAISVYDRGFLYGDSVFEVIRTYGGKPFGLREHVERLHRSAHKLAMELPWSVDTLFAEVTAAVSSIGFAESYVRIVVTRGAGPLGLDPDLADVATRVVLIHPLVLPPAHVFRDGVSMLALETMRATDFTTAEGAKASNYLANLLALREAKKRGAFEPLFVQTTRDSSKGAALAAATEIEVLEGGTSNVFALFGRDLITPPERRILSGITRKHVMEAAPGAGFSVRVEPITLDRLRGADEVFFTSTIREVVPVVAILEDASLPLRPGVESGAKHRIGQGVPGPGTRALHVAFRHHVGASASPMPWE